MGGPVNVALIVVVVALRVASSVASRGGWSSAHATYYGDVKGAETMKGSCGYGNPMESGYGLETAALSTALFNGGLTCGACYEIKCHNSPRWCMDNTIHVTATNLCPPSRRCGHNWCDLPNQHFDLSQPMFGEIAKYEAGVVPILYHRALCVRSGGIRFEIKGNSDWILVLVSNVGGAGDVKEVKVKGSGSEWISMAQNWQCSVRLVGQSLSFRVTTSDGKKVQSDNVALAD